MFKRREKRLLICSHYALRAKRYGACVRAAKALGYKKIITYTLASETGASLKASNFVSEGEAGGEIWTGKRRRDNGVPTEKKIRWVYHIG